MHTDHHEADTLGQVTARVQVWYGCAFIVVGIYGQLMNLEAIIVIFVDHRERGKTLEEGVIRDAADFKDGVVDFQRFAVAIATKGGNTARNALLETEDPGFIAGIQEVGSACHDIGDARVVGKAEAAV